jgi:hypothetical protein
MTDTPTIDQTVARIIDALTAATREYGPDAVDLGLSRGPHHHPCA